MKCVKTGINIQIGDGPVYRTDAFYLEEEGLLVFPGIDGTHQLSCEAPVDLLIREGKAYFLPNLILAPAGECILFSPAIARQWHHWESRLYSEIPKNLKGAAKCDSM